MAVHAHPNSHLSQRNLWQFLAFLVKFTNQPLLQRTSLAKFTGQFATSQLLFNVLHLQSLQGNSLPINFCFNAFHWKYSRDNSQLLLLRTLFAKFTGQFVTNQLLFIRLTSKSRRGQSDRRFHYVSFVPSVKCFRHSKHLFYALEI